MRIDDFFKNNYDAFNSEEPKDGHFERFEKRLKASKQRYRFITLQRLMGMAAVMAGILVGLMFFMRQQANSSEHCVMSDEMIETQNYYLAIINSEAAHIEKLLTKVDPDTQNEVMADVRIIVSGSKSFTSEFCNNSESGTAIMVEFYQAKIQALQNIISIFETSDRKIINRTTFS